MDGKWGENNQSIEPYWQLRSDVIKIMAMVFMLIDHIGAGILEPIYLNVTDYNLSMKIYYFKVALKAIGRLAFPIFCYQLVQGFGYTRNRILYLRNLFVFALISEIPFNLLESRKVVNTSGQSVMVTLFLGGIVIVILDKCKEFKPVIRYILSAVAIASISTVAYLAHTDYNAKGIILIAIIYFLKDDKIKLIQLGPILFLIDIFTVTLLTTKNMHFTIEYCEFSCTAIFSFFLMYLDNGKRQFGRWLKWLGYWFYPVHLLILYFVSKLVMNLLFAGV
ncbi:MAG: TraX family protein [Lachnospiraceae bacterium]|nr:TraX family protein [Lachnospiraceae bacterium]